ncbi:hypothetical protein WN982_12645 [Paraburkholderia sp. IMGN_8]|uniref:hypothetical protein n=1 Tax=Paraburkholderia sp. IMGN_8 TaxID=3136564 RepID=UPI0031016450
MDKLIGPMALLAMVASLTGCVVAPGYDYAYAQPYYPGYVYPYGPAYAPVYGTIGFWGGGWGGPCCYHGNGHWHGGGEHRDGGRGGWHGGGYGGYHGGGSSWQGGSGEHGGRSH